MNRRVTTAFLFMLGNPRDAVILAKHTRRSELRTCEHNEVSCQPIFSVSDRPYTNWNFLSSAKATSGNGFRQYCFTILVVGSSASFDSHGMPNA